MSLVIDRRAMGWANIVKRWGSRDSRCCIRVGTRWVALGCLVGSIDLCMVGKTRLTVRI